MKSIAFIVFCFLCTITQVAYAGGGEHENTHCNGVGNPNSYCDGTEETPTECPVPPTPVVHNHVCVVPLQAATTYLTTSNFFFNPDPKICAKQCKTIAKTCSNVAKAQGKCYAGVIKGARTLSLANCKAVSDPLVRAQCRWNVTHNSGENLEVFKAATLTATAFCNDTVQDCVAACND